jgi:hypothetical protein
VQSHIDSVALDLEHIDGCPAGAKQGTDLVDPPPDPRLKVRRVEPIKNQKTANQVVRAEIINETCTVVSRLRYDLEQSIKGRGVQVHHRLHQVFRYCPESRVGACLQFANQLIDSPNAFLKSRIFGHVFAVRFHL